VASGAAVTISAVNLQNSPMLLDWYVFPSNKNFDSRRRAKWRAIGFHLSVWLLGFSLIGAVLEGIEKVREKHEPFSPQHCLESLISDLEGDSPEESKRMRRVLEKVLIEGVPVRSALDHLDLNEPKKLKFWFATRGEFRSRLAHLIAELSRYLSRL
jgi:hypothetical protein